MTRNKSNEGIEIEKNKVKGLNRSSKTFETHLPKLTEMKQQFEYLYGVNV